VPAILPPPVPISPFLLGAGAMDYPVKKYLLALTAGRALRFTLVAYLASLFGRSLFRLFSEHYGKILVGLIVVAASAGAIFAVYHFRRKRKNQEALDEA
jgi:membrane protein DedA with SNARE-associated domain